MRLILIILRIKDIGKLQTFVQNLTMYLLHVNKVKGAMPTRLHNDPSRGKGWKGRRRRKKNNNNTRKKYDGRGRSGNGSRTTPRRKKKKNEEEAR